MFCPNCGIPLANGVRFCKSCGAAQIPQSPTPLSTSVASLVGFSPRIADPSYTKYVKNTKRWALLFSGILFVIATIAFPIYGNASGEVDFPESLFYGMGIGGMFVVIALVQTIRQGKDTTWDGTVIDKTSARKSRQDSDGDGHHHYMEYVVKIRMDNGKVKKHRSIDQPGFYNYYRIGERVRHHKGLYGYEKFDKSQDAEILCVACMKMNSVLLDKCERCKCPVLKM